MDHPCGYSNNSCYIEHNAGASTVSNKDLVTQSAVVLNWVRDFQESYVSRTSFIYYKGLGRPPKGERRDNLILTVESAGISGKLVPHRPDAMMAIT
nr:unnamed protein product [Callosobruchus chinensis]